MRWSALALAIACIAGAPSPAAAQAEPVRAWTVVPWLGFGVVRAGESWNSGGMEAAVELSYERAGRWRASAWASERGIGVGCSEACFEGGPAFAVSAARGIGRSFWLGAGAGTMHQHSRWRFVPFGRATWDADRVRLDFRIERPQQDGSGVYFPLLVGLPL